MVGILELIQVSTLLQLELTCKEEISMSLCKLRFELLLSCFTIIFLTRCDWSAGAGTINYISARNRVPDVANILARLLDFFVANNLTQMNTVNIAGHSLGAHIAGLTGKRVTQGRIGVIFSLDPAGLLFSIDLPNERFAADDALYTEGIRTNSGNLGFSGLLAHADFFPNGGSRFAQRKRLKL